MGKLAIKKAEQAGVDGLGKGLTAAGNNMPGPLGGLLGKAGAALGKKPDTTVTAVNKSNTILEQILSVLQQANGHFMSGASDSSSGDSGSSGGSLFASIFSKTASKAASGAGGDDSGDFNSFENSEGGGGFGGQMAMGGDVTAGMTYDVGEMGRERFTPTQNGKITPNKNMGGNSHTFNIDARGSNDPAQTEMAIHRAMKQYAPHMAGGTAGAMADNRSRRPSRA